MRSLLPSFDKRNVPVKFVSITAFHPFSVMSLAQEGNCPPPLFIKKSILSCSLSIDGCNCIPEKTYCYKCFPCSSKSFEISSKNVLDNLQISYLMSSSLRILHCNEDIFPIEESFISASFNFFISREAITTLHPKIKKRLVITY